MMISKLHLSALAIIFSLHTVQASCLQEQDNKDVQDVHAVSSAPFLELPNELLCFVSQHLAPEDIASVSQTCQHLHSIVMDSDFMTGYCGLTQKAYNEIVTVQIPAIFNIYTSQIQKILQAKPRHLYARDLMALTHKDNVATLQTNDHALIHVICERFLRNNLNNDHDQTAKAILLMSYARYLFTGDIDEDETVTIEQQQKYTIELLASLEEKKLEILLPYADKVFRTNGKQRSRLNILSSIDEIDLERLNVLLPHSDNFFTPDDTTTAENQYTAHSFILKRIPMIDTEKLKLFLPYIDKFFTSDVRWLDRLRILSQLNRVDRQTLKVFSTHVTQIVTPDMNGLACLDTLMYLSHFRDLNLTDPQRLACVLANIESMTHKQRERDDNPEELRKLERYKHLVKLCAQTYK